jgi:UDP-N-acetylmuramoyl-tripeptide--D-alanyl-D-alanine ligase
MGANHHKEIEFLCAIAKPDFGYITNFGKAHLEGFGSIEGVIEAKSELYNYLRENKKTVFVNPSDETQVQKTTEIKTILFDNSIKLHEANPFVKVKFDSVVITTNLIGAYNYSNISAAITIGKYFNINTKNISSSLESYTSTNNRSQIITTEKNNTLILDAYNANPTSMKAALDSFSKINSINKVIILGDMFELGSESEKEHQLIADYCTELNFKNVLLVGKLFSDVKSDHLKIETFEELKEYIITTKICEHQILIKGSRGMALERITEFL